MRYVIGIDEVGRGPLAGPVVVAAVLLPANWRPRGAGRRPDLRDSKQLSQIQRETWYEHLIAHPKVRFFVAEAQPRTIDEMNIARAADRAARIACEKLLAEGGVQAGECAIYLDGGLYLKTRTESRRRTLVHTEEVLLDAGAVIVQTIVKGDGLIPAIRIASIFAKVHRDRLMLDLAKEYPGYGFDRHKGYATKEHYAAIKKLGLSAIHRLTFTGSLHRQAGSLPPRAFSEAGF